MSWNKPWPTSSTTTIIAATTSNGQHETKPDDPGTLLVHDLNCPENFDDGQWHPEQNPEGRWRKYTYEELSARDKTSLDVFRPKDKSLTDLDNLPEPDELAEEIIENLEAGLNSFREVGPPPVGGPVGMLVQVRSWS